MHLLLRLTYERDIENYNGLSELLEILSSICSGYTVPLKSEHIEFFTKVLIPLHKMKTLSTFHTQLLQCFKHFIEKDHNMIPVAILGLLKIWPITNPAKEVLFLNEIEEIMEVSTDAFPKFGEKFVQQLCRCVKSEHYQVAERALVFINGEMCNKLVKKGAHLKTIARALIWSSKKHWNQTVSSLAITVMKSYQDQAPDQFSTIEATYERDEQRVAQRTEQRKRLWSKLEQATAE